MIEHRHLSVGFDQLIRLMVVAWTVSVILAHSLLEPPWLWWSVALLSSLMNVTYPWAAMRAGQFRSLESAIALTLIGASLLGALLDPMILILAVALHGAWDAAKHTGAGVAFFRWYTLACLAFDLAWAAFLLWLWLSSR